MSIKYFGKNDIKTKIIELITEMAEDTEIAYTISIHEGREDEKISKLLIEVSNIEDTMPNF